MIFIGGPALTDGFRLIGFETLVNPKVAEVDTLIDELQESRTNSFMVIEQTQDLSASKRLREIRSEGGRIVISEVPALKDPSCLECELDRQIDKLMGKGGVM
jgi:vacuolar-type H+-ATPase subunit F/Vma7